MSDTGDSTPLMTSREAMRYLNVSRTTLWRLTRDGMLPAYRIGGDLRFKMADIQGFLERQKVAPDSGEKESDNA